MKIGILVFLMFFIFISYASADNFRGELLTNKGVITTNTSANIVHTLEIDIDKDGDIDILFISDKEDMWLLRNITNERTIL